MSINTKEYEVEALQFLASPEIGRDYYFNGEDIEIINALKQVIAIYKAEKRFGLNIINPNMSLSASETTLESTDEKQRISHMSTLSRCSDELINSRPTSWSFENGQDIFSAACRGYCNYSDYKHSNLHSSNVTFDSCDLTGKNERDVQDIDSVALPTDISALPHIDDVAHFSEEDSVVLNALKEIIVSYSQEHRIGIMLIHKHFDVSSTEVLLEKYINESRETVVFAADVGEDRSNLAASAILFKKVH